MAVPKSTIPAERIERSILLIRGHKVMIDKDLAALYEVKPIALRQQVKRNKETLSSRLHVSTQCEGG